MLLFIGELLRSVTGKGYQAHACAHSLWSYWLGTLLPSLTRLRARGSLLLVTQLTEPLVQKECSWRSKLEVPCSNVSPNPIRLPIFFPIGQWNRLKLTEVRHLTNPLELRLVSNGTNMSLMGFIMEAVMLFSLITQPCVL